MGIVKHESLKPTKADEFKYILSLSLIAGGRWACDLAKASCRKLL